MPCPLETLRTFEIDLQGSRGAVPRAGKFVFSCVDKGEVIPAGAAHLCPRVWPQDPGMLFLERKSGSQAAEVMVGWQPTVGLPCSLTQPQDRL